MTDLRRVALVAALGAAAAVALPAAAQADEATTTHEQLSPATPLDQLLSTPGDVIGTLADGSPI